MTSKVVSIHQPNFFWLGYFEKIVRSDYFIFLDNVQFPKKGGSWTNRVKLIVSGQPKWLTANINRQYHGTLLINEMTFAQGNPWRAKIIKSLQTSYSKHPFFDQTMDILDPLIMNSETNISEYNICAVTSLASAIGIDCDKFTRASAFPISDISTARLCVLANSVAADTYLSGVLAAIKRINSFLLMVCPLNIKTLNTRCTPTRMIPLLLDFPSLMRR